jgi:hypothetical protein
MSTIGNTNYTLPESITLDLGGSNSTYVQNRDTGGKSIVVEFETQKSNKSVVLAAYGDAVRLDGVRSVQISSLTTYPVTIAYANQANDDGATVRLEPSDSFAQSLATVDTVDTVNTVSSLSDIVNKWKTGPSTTTALAANDSYVSAWLPCADYAAVVAMAYSDQDCTLKLKWNYTGTPTGNADVGQAEVTETITGGSFGQGLVYYNRGPFFLMEVVNGSTAQSYLYASSNLRRI